MAGPGLPCPLSFREPQSVLAWWQAARPAGGGLPARRQIDPRAFPRALPCIFLCVYEPDLGDFRYRLSGEEINAVFGRSLKGLALNEVFTPADSWRAVYRSLARVIERPAVCHGTGRVYNQLDRYSDGERLMLPLLDDAGGCTTILGVTRYQNPASKTRRVHGQPAPGAAVTPTQGAADRGRILDAAANGLDEQCYAVETAAAWRA